MVYGDVAWGGVWTTPLKRSACAGAPRKSLHVSPRLSRRRSHPCWPHLVVWETDLLAQQPVKSEGRSGSTRKHGPCFQSTTFLDEPLGCSSCQRHPRFFGESSILMLRYQSLASTSGEYDGALTVPSSSLQWESR